MRAAGRSYWRRAREFRAAVPDTEARELDYDCIDRMNRVDQLERPWRDLVNEHGFVAVVKCRQESRDIEEVTEMLRSRHQMRQRQLATGSY
jgi:hypothetical protein